MKPAATPSRPPIASWTTLNGLTIPVDQLEEEIDDLTALLMEHATHPGILAQHLARALAIASMGPNHLWQDLGLADRGQLNALMQEHFTSLKALNVGQMRWKKFFYRQLCERAQILICKSPHCEACTELATCFAPELAETPHSLHLSTNTATLA